jgi:hypothetical protein
MNHSIDSQTRQAVRSFLSVANRQLTPEALMSNYDFAVFLAYDKVTCGDSLKEAWLTNA